MYWNKYQSKTLQQRQNQYSDYLVDLSFPGVNRLFVLTCEYETDRAVHTGHHLQKVQIKDYNVMGETFMDCGSIATHNCKFILVWYSVSIKWLSTKV